MTALSNRRIAVAAALVLSAGAASRLSAQQLPEGPGKAETEKLCVKCHELARSIAPRQDRDGWHATMTKMSMLGMKATDEEIQAVSDYLSKNFPAADLAKLKINEAKAIDFESAFSLRRSQAMAIIAYRTKNGAFRSMEDLKKVPGIDFARIEARKDRIAF